MKIFYIAWLTFHEARRRRLLLVGFGLGLAFLLLYGISFYALHQNVVNEQGINSFVTREISSSFTMMGLYAVNFLVVMLSVLAAVDTVSGEIASHSIQSIVTKPIRRWEVMLGKWLGFATMITATVVLLAGGVVLIGGAIGGLFPNNIFTGLALMILVGWVLLALTLLGGTRFSTLTNGVIVFMLFALAFIGGWTEQLGAVTNNQTAINIGIISSLLMPTEALWKRAAYLMQPASLTGLYDSPFVTTSVPSPAMIAYAVLYGLAALGIAVWIFQKRDL